MVIQQFLIKVVWHIVKVAFYHKLSRGNLILSLFPQIHATAWTTQLWQQTKRDFPSVLQTNRSLCWLRSWHTLICLPATSTLLMLTPHLALCVAVSCYPLVLRLNSTHQETLLILWQAHVSLPLFTFLASFAFLLLWFMIICSLFLSVSLRIM